MFSLRDIAVVYMSVPRVPRHLTKKQRKNRMAAKRARLARRK